MPPSHDTWQHARLPADPVLHFGHATVETLSGVAGQAGFRGPWAETALSSAVIKGLGAGSFEASLDV